MPVVAAVAVGAAVAVVAAAVGAAVGAAVAIVEVVSFAMDDSSLNSVFVSSVHVEAAASP